MRLPPLTEGRLVQRRNRFVAEVELDGRVVEAHCPNTGSMLGCKAPGSRVWLSPAENPERKLRWTWEIVEALPGVLVGLHTGRPNGLVEEALRAGRLTELAHYTEYRREVRYGRENSRIDLLLQGEGLPPCYVEVKNVTAAVNGGVGFFPDAVTERGAKHLREMMAVVAQGARAVLVFCVQRGDVREVQPADHIDPVYGRTLREALAAGVEVYALGAEVEPAAIVLDRRLPVLIR
ncbi:MAG: DNA/RNA nuclease SfsA [Azonexus sp.]|nr:DNA/RNA nuclease SfsA [Betaproteobacteria bacterium]MBK8919780.1 DNA/RNA nuclease SfsA [Betaproteobacteria bacterium]MBP6035639.1 DNA/RNA nuclease SfsA [Azonexus sp.]MBP6908134.1 DNA/RNA nuclease SfsA [Azonexus sp.]